MHNALIYGKHCEHGKRRPNMGRFFYLPGIRLPLRLKDTKITFLPISVRRIFSISALEVKGFMSGNFSMTVL